MSDKLPEKETKELTENELSILTKKIQKLGNTNLKIFNYFINEIINLKNRISELELRIKELNKKDEEN